MSSCSVRRKGQTWRESLFAILRTRLKIRTVLGYQVCLVLVKLASNIPDCTVSRPRHKCEGHNNWPDVSNQSYRTRYLVRMLIGRDYKAGTSGHTLRTFCPSICLINTEKQTSAVELTAFQHARNICHCLHTVEVAACVSDFSQKRRKDERLASRLHGYRDRPGRVEEKLV
jgi:hypothetical protein